MENEFEIGAKITGSLGKVFTNLGSSFSIFNLHTLPRIRYQCERHTLFFCDFITRSPTSRKNSMPIFWALFFLSPNFHILYSLTIENYFTWLTRTTTEALVWYWVHQKSISICLTEFRNGHSEIRAIDNRTQFPPFKISDRILLLKDTISIF